MPIQFVSGDLIDNARSSGGCDGPRTSRPEHGIVLGIEPLHREIYGGLVDRDVDPPGGRP